MSIGGLSTFKREADRVEKTAVSIMDSKRRIIQVISAMQADIRKLELENMGLKRKAGSNLRKNASVPIMAAECRGTLISLLLCDIR